MEKYNLDLPTKHLKIEEDADRIARNIRKAIGFQIFNTIRYSCVGEDVQERISLAKYVYKSIFDKESSYLAIDLKYNLSMVGVLTINRLISDEYKHILDLEYKIETLESDLRLYKALYESKKQ
jgi:hypothetical protein